LKALTEARQRDAQHHQEAKEQAQRKQGELEAEIKRLRNIEQELAEARRKAQTAEAAQAELDRVRQRAEEQIQQLRASQDKTSDEQVKALQAQLDELRKREAQSEKQRKDLESEISALKAAGSSDSSAASAELAKLREENKQLETWLAEAEEKAKQGGGSGEGGGPELEDLRRRFEMAIQDVRELKTKNAELTEQVARGRQAGAASGGGGGGGSDWESMKQKMLAQLESDFDEADEAQKAEKLTVQQAIQTTDQALAEKERELEELRKLLDSQAQQVGAVAVGASAIAQVLDTDELIRQERETLKQLQESLREQLAKAEIDISLERAKQARERAELEEKMRTMEAERSNGSTPGDANGDKGKKAGGRKWLTRLGLGDTKGE
jgi:chromosome segregation ATPase